MYIRIYGYRNVYSLSVTARCVCLLNLAFGYQNRKNVVVNRIILSRLPYVGTKGYRKNMGAWRVPKATILYLFRQ